MQGGVKGSAGPQHSVANVKELPHGGSENDHFPLLLQPFSECFDCCVASKSAHSRKVQGSTQHDVSSLRHSVAYQCCELTEEALPRCATIPNRGRLTADEHRETAVRGPPSAVFPEGGAVLGFQLTDLKCYLIFSGEHLQEIARIPGGFLPLNENLLHFRKVTGGRQANTALSKQITFLDTKLSFLSAGGNCHLCRSNVFGNPRVFPRDRSRYQRVAIGGDTLKGSGSVVFAITEAFSGPLSSPLSIPPPLSQAGPTMRTSSMPRRARRMPEAFPIAFMGKEEGLEARVVSEKGRPVGEIAKP